MGSEIKKENQKLLKDLEISLKRIDEMLPFFVLDKEKKTHLEKLRNEVISYILETN